MHDMRPKPRAKAAAAPVPVRTVSFASTKNVTIARGRKPAKESREPLKKRRKQKKKSLVIALSVLGAILIALLVYVLWLPALRMQNVTASGPHAEEARSIVQQQIAGTYALVLPRNSMFLIPEQDIREALLTAFPDVEAVSLTASDLNTLSATLLPRAGVFVWCGSTPEAAYGSCFEANAEGLIFAALSPEAASSSQALRVYAPLADQEGDSPVRAHVEYAARIPDVLRFVKAAQTLGANVESFTLRGDEADLHTDAGTRITYVLGHEEQAAIIAASVFPQLELNDGSVSYVDLRFEGKAYFKRTADITAETGE